MYFRLQLLLTMALLCSLSLHAMEPDTTRLITRATSYGAGTANIFDTYLSPVNYHGVDFRFTRENTRLTRWGDGKFTAQTFFQGDVSYVHNRADNNKTLYMLANWNYGVHYNMNLLHNLKLQLGGVGDLNGGFVYNMRNGNNPAQARAYINVDASAAIRWDVKIHHKPVHLRYQLNVPLAGVMFMPHYDESYYEIFSIGNGGGVVNFTSLHNAPSLRQIVSADFPLSRLYLRLSYVWDAQQAHVNGVKTHAYQHVFLVGFVKHLYAAKRFQKGGKK